MRKLDKFSNKVKKKKSLKQNVSQEEYDPTPYSEWPKEIVKPKTPWDIPKESSEKELDVKSVGL
jgi:hypothetical protein